MKVQIDRQDVRQIHQQTINKIRRFYYLHDQWPQLLLVSQERPLEQLLGQMVVALRGEPDSTIVCDIMPAAPQRWRDEKIVQVTVKVVDHPGRQDAETLSYALDYFCNRFRRS